MLSLGKRQSLLGLRKLLVLRLQRELRELHRGRNRERLRGRRGDKAVHIWPFCLSVNVTLRKLHLTLASSRCDGPVLTPTADGGRDSHRRGRGRVLLLHIVKGRGGRRGGCV